MRFNFNYFPFKIAKKLPVFISRRTRFSKLKGIIIIDSEKISIGMIRIGFGDVPIFDSKYSRTVMNISGEIVFKGKADIGHGSKIGCGGNLTFGNNFTITAESTIVCDNKIIFGDDVLLSWQIQIMDTDFHKVLYNHSLSDRDPSIIVGKHTWIGSRVIVNKGVKLPNNTVVANGSIVTKSFEEAGLLLGGIPAKVLRTNVSWEK